MSAPSSQVVSIHSPELFEAAVERAVALLRSGQVVALPTETVYGLAANAFNSEAVRKIFEIKGRPAHNPVIVHVSSRLMAKDCVEPWPELADKLADAFWPGPLTLVLVRSGRIPDAVTAGGPTVGIRWPNHPFMQAVIERCAFPVAAPSANPSTALSPTRAEHVRKSLGSRVPLIVDGGPCVVGIESTVLDLTMEPPRVWRQGMIHTESLLAVTGRLAAGTARGEGALRSPGMLERHYAPKAVLRVCSWRNEKELLGLAARERVPSSQIHVIAHGCVPSGRSFGRVSVIPHDAEAFARALYAELHACDEEGARLILVEAPPATAEWRGIADRLARASRLP
jgi:L-threonylcarbamoyladenylate synthase